MSIPTPNLQAFIEPVPTCSQTTRLAQVLEIFSQNQCDRVMVVNQAFSPLGLVHLRRFMPHLMASLGEATAIANRSDGQSIPMPHTPINLQQSISASAIEPSIIEPLATLSADLDLEQFWPYLQDQPEIPGAGQDWALVDADGKFLGLLDLSRLLKFMATNLLPEQERLENFELLKLNSQLNAKLAENSLLKTLQPLIKLLKRLPLPLRLQTSTGQILARNLAWRRQFPLLRDAVEDETLSAVSGSRASSSPRKENLGEWLEMDSESGTSQGVCPMPNPSQKVWEFVKIPLSIALPKQRSTIQPDSEQRVDSLEVPNGREAKSSVSPPTNKSFSPAISAKPGEDKKDVLLATGVSEGGVKQSYPVGNRAPSGQKTNRGPHGQGRDAASTRGKESQNLDESATVDTSPLTITSEETLWLLMAQDVTEQKQVAQELAAKNADLVQLNRLKDEFLACISHELKTPLTAVLGLSSLLKDRAIGPLNERQARYARLIYQSGRHLMTVVNDILDLTRIETNQIELILEPVNLLSACDRAYKGAHQNQTSEEQSQSTSGDTDVAPETQFTLEIEPGLQTLIADEMRLRQMLVNLLSNALKFTEPGGAIGLKVSRWEGWIAFTVWDTGIGIPDHKQHLIFQKFQQLENPLTRRFEGAGLGLVLTQRLARLHGGDVTFISSEGKGSEFTLLLPPCPPQPGDILPEAIAQRRRLVLIVEAVPRFIEELTEQLADLGYRAAIARTGTEALEKARRFSPEVIFLNPVLPLLSGWDVLTLLKSDPATCHIPVIVTATQAEKELALQNGAYSFLSLPVQTSALRLKLARLNEPERDSSTRLIVLRLNTISIPVSTPQRDSYTPDAATEYTIPHPLKGERNNNQNRYSADNNESELLAIAPDEQTSEISELMADLNNLLHRHNCRVLEADELEQAELLARVWQPNVVLLNTACGLDNPLTYLKQLSQYNSLATLPLVTLEQEITRTAHQVPGLSVFSCFGTAGAKSTPSALMQVLQVAAGTIWKPSILVVDISNLPDLFPPPSPSNEPSSFIFPTPSLPNESLPALIQYIQTAGFRGLIGRSWAEVLRLLEHQSLDLLLICGRPATPHPALLEALASLGHLAAQPPILVLGKRRDDELKANVSTPHYLLDRILQEIATQLLPSDLSMAALLNEINQILVIKK